jgi:glycosyltransferase involved in cell wall biosynthesis
MSKVLYVIDSPYAWSGGCWYYRNHIPAKGLKGRGHEIRFMTIPAHGDVPEDYYNFPDTVVFSRTYPRDPLMIMREFKKRGKRVIYEIDDDLWDVNPDNPSVSISTEKNFQYENFMREVNAVTTTTETLANKIRKFNKNVYVVPNCIDYDVYKKRDGNNKKLVVGYTGAASHWGDLQIITDVVANLQNKYDFDFILEGMCGSPLENEMYSFQQIKLLNLAPEKKAYYDTALAWWEKMRHVKFTHIPFHFPQLFPEILRRCNMDIGLAPLYDNEFNHSKSCLKFYEYASMGTVTLASDVLPYNKEVGYCAKNNYKDWYDKLEKLLTDQKFREELGAKQSKWVEENRGLGNISMLWEKAFDSPSK